MNRLLVLISLLCVACEDQVNVQLPDAPEVVVIDAWVNTKNEPQTISLSKTQPYFDNSAPKGISGAVVTITSTKGDVYAFQERESGMYVWDPSTTGQQITDELIGYTLSVDITGDRYQAFSQIRRVPPVDSIKFTFKEERNTFQPAGYYGEFVALDPVGPGDSYWIKSFKNGQLLNKPFELNIAYDAGFNEGGNIDGVVFIQPIQDAVNPLNEDLDEFVPYQPGDSLYVELHSITNEAFYFLQEVQIQTQRDGGFDEIFAEPLENVSTNIRIVQGDPDAKVVGFFSMSSVTSRGRKLLE